MGLCIKWKTNHYDNNFFQLPLPSPQSYPNHLGLGLPHQMCCAWSPRACKFRLADLQGKQRSVRSSLWETHFASNTNLSLPINVLKRRPFYPVCERKSARSAGKQHRLDGHKINWRSQAGSTRYHKPKREEKSARPVCDSSVQKRTNTSAHPRERCYYFICFKKAVR